MSTRDATILTVNAGSSSLRLALFRRDDSATPLAAERYEMVAGVDNGVGRLREFLSATATDVVGVAHRVVHGGDTLTAPCRIDERVELEIERWAMLAPLHNPVALAGIRAARALLRDVPQIAVFDTAFYASLPAVARRYALPAALAPVNVRYGFHGIAHEAMSRRWRTLNPVSATGARVISFQLGAGCSVTAIRNGHALDTSMGFSPLEGLVMATRCGDIDPGLLLYLVRRMGIPPDRLDAILNRESGLLGASGASADMRVLLESDDPAAKLAIELYAYRARKYLGAYLAVLGGADAILFGGGVGEHAASVRARILADLEWAGIVLDPTRNELATAGECRISADDSRVQVWVLAADEASALARAAIDVLRA
mgnify:CR=1 FL=1